MAAPKQIRELRAKALTLFRGDVAQGALTTLRASVDGAPLAAADIDAMLAKAVARERVSLIADVLAYEQGRRDAQGNVVMNRKGLRFRDGAMMSLGRSGKGTPFMRDHRQGDSTARGGTVLSSRTEKLTEDGHYQVHQTVELTEPSAVERALRGNMSTVSIGWNPTGPVLCTACGTEIFSACFHFPFDVVTQKNGTQVTVQWEVTDAELVETSEVPVPGVQSAEIKSIRAALSAGNNPDPEVNNMDPEVLKLLGLSADATVEQIKAAIAELNTKIKAGGAELSISAADVTSMSKRLAELEAQTRQSAEDKFIDGAILTGRIGKGDEEHWRALFAADAKRATELMAKRTPNTATPVGAPPQTPKTEPGKPQQSITGGTSRRAVGLTKQAAAAVEQLAAAGPKALGWAASLGFQDPDGRFPELTTLAATSITSNDQLDPARVGFHAAFMQQLALNVDDPIGAIYTEVASSHKSETYNWMGDLPGFQEWIGDRKIKGLDGYKWAIDNKKWSNGIRVKNDDIKDDALGLLPAQVTGLAGKARRHRFDLMIKLLLNGFDGNAYPEVGNGLAYDGNFFFADAHLGGNDNKMTVALDSAGLAAAELLMRSMTTYDGNDPLDVYGTHLIVGPKLEPTALKLMTQERLANGEDNVNRGKYKLLVSNRIRGAQDDYWFLADLSQPIKPLLFQMREEISTSAILGQTNNESMQSFMTDELLFGAQARYNVGYLEFRTIVGSQL